MMTKQSILVCIFILFIFSGCIEDECHTPEEVSRSIAFNITSLFPDTLGALAGLNPASFQMKVYTLEDTMHVDYHLTNKHVTLELPRNNAGILLYTSDFYDVDATFYRGLKKPETIEAYTRTEMVDGRLYMEEPDPVFSSYIEIASSQSLRKIDFMLYPRVFVYRFGIKVEGLTLIKKAIATISGMYSSVYLKDGSHAEDNEAVMKINLRLKGDSIEGEFRSFGTHQRKEVMHRMAVRFTNIAGETRVVELNDLTSQIKALPHGGIIKTNQIIKITGEENNGGFKPGMDDWNDENVTLPIW